jgi:hypothetical protein
VVFRTEVESIRKERYELAQKVQELADQLRYEEKATGGTRSKVLNAAVDVIERIASQTGEGWIVAERDRHDPAHAFAILMAMQFDWLFGTPCFKHTARIASVALNCDVPWTRVRDWWKAEGSPRGWAHRAVAEEE